MRDSPTCAAPLVTVTTSLGFRCSSATITVISFVMLAIGTRSFASCCASTSPVVPLTTYHARASDSCGDAWAPAASASAAALLDAKLLTHLERIRTDTGVERLELLDGDSLLRRNRAEGISGLHDVEPFCRRLPFAGRGRRRRVPGRDDGRG